MVATIKFLKQYPDGPYIPFATVKEILKPGDYGIADGVVVQVNQSTCIYHNTKVIGTVNKDVVVFDGEEVELVYDCKAESCCSYPFCGKACPGNKENFRILGKEKRSW